MQHITSLFYTILTSPSGLLMLQTIVIISPINTQYRSTSSTMLAAPPHFAPPPYLFLFLQCQICVLWGATNKNKQTLGNLIRAVWPSCICIQDIGFELHFKPSANLFQIQFKRIGLDCLNMASEGQVQENGGLF